VVELPNYFTSTI